MVRENLRVMIKGRAPTCLTKVPFENFRSPECRHLRVGSELETPSRGSRNPTWGQDGTVSVGNSDEETGVEDLRGDGDTRKD